ncbi:MAG: prephenate/arogenate dehydrogenase family protein [Alphaproteobacteria bacterium]|nr:prephenate/arogenate dehydrogenase family protein [Alphaproteobacteria bacterium]
MFENITIIGMGLIGSSLARVIRQKNLARKLVGVDCDPNVCARAAGLNLTDVITSNAREGVIHADLVLVCVPVGAYEQLAVQIGPALKAGAYVSDVGSVKQAAIKSLEPWIPESVHFVPAHPIAGTEHSGPEAGMADLFSGRWCILTPGPSTDLKAIERMTAFWESCGARIAVMEPQHHDKVLAMTSHLPHLIAYTIVDTATQLEDDIKGEVIQYSASGFRGFTRIAASDPVMWRDVFLYNREAVLEILQRFSEDLTAMQKAIRRSDGAFLQEVFTRTRAIRKNILALGPEGTPAPEHSLTRSES